MSRLSQNTPITLAQRTQLLNFYSVIKPLLDEVDYAIEGDHPPDLSEPSLFLLSSTPCNALSGSPRHINIIPHQSTQFFPHNTSQAFTPSISRDGSIASNANDSLPSPRHTNSARQSSKDGNLPNIVLSDVTASFLRANEAVHCVKQREFGLRVRFDGLNLLRQIISLSITRVHFLLSVKIDNLRLVMKQNQALVKSYRALLSDAQQFNRLLSKNLHEMNHQRQRSDKNIDSVYWKRQHQFYHTAFAHFSGQYPRGCLFEVINAMPQKLRLAALSHSAVLSIVRLETLVALGTQSIANDYEFIEVIDSYNNKVSLFIDYYLNLHNSLLSKTVTIVMEVLSNPSIDSTQLLDPKSPYYHQLLMNICQQSLNQDPSAAPTPDDSLSHHNRNSNIPQPKRTGSKSPSPTSFPQSASALASPVIMPTPQFPNANLNTTVNINHSNYPYRQFKNEFYRLSGISNSLTLFSPSLRICYPHSLPKYNLTDPSVVYKTLTNTASHTPCSSPRCIYMARDRTFYLPSAYRASYASLVQAHAQFLNPAHSQQQQLPSSLGVPKEPHDIISRSPLSTSINTIQAAQPLTVQQLIKRSMKDNLACLSSVQQFIYYNLLRAMQNQSLTFHTDVFLNSLISEHNSNQLSNIHLGHLTRLINKFIYCQYHTAFYGNRSVHINNTPVSLATFSQQSQNSFTSFPFAPFSFASTNQIDQLSMLLQFSVESHHVCSHTTTPEEQSSFLDTSPKVCCSLQHALRDRIFYQKEYLVFVHTLLNKHYNLHTELNDQAITQHFYQDLDDSKSLAQTQPYPVNANLLDDVSHDEDIAMTNLNTTNPAIINSSHFAPISPSHDALFSPNGGPTALLLSPMASATTTSTTSFTSSSYLAEISSSASTSDSQLHYAPSFCESTPPHGACIALPPSLITVGLRRFKVHPYYTSGIYGLLQQHDDSSITTQGLASTSSQNYPPTVSSVHQIPPVLSNSTSFHAPRLHQTMSNHTPHPPKVHNYTNSPPCACYARLYSSPHKLSQNTSRLPISIIASETPSSPQVQPQKRFGFSPQHNPRFTVSTAVPPLTHFIPPSFYELSGLKGSYVPSPPINNQERLSTRLATIDHSIKQLESYLFASAPVSSLIFHPELSSDFMSPIMTHTPGTPIDTSLEMLTAQIDRKSPPHPSLTQDMSDEHPFNFLHSLPITPTAPIKAVPHSGLDLTDSGSDSDSDQGEMDARTKMNPYANTTNSFMADLSSTDIDDFNARQKKHKLRLKYKLQAKRKEKENTINNLPKDNHNNVINGNISSQADELPTVGSPTDEITILHTQQDAHNSNSSTRTRKPAPKPKPSQRKVLYIQTHNYDPQYIDPTPTLHSNSNSNQPLAQHSQTSTSLSIGGLVSPDASRSVQSSSNTSFPVVEPGIDPIDGYEILARLEEMIFVNVNSHPAMRMLTELKQETLSAIHDCQVMDGLDLDNSSPSHQAGSSGFGLNTHASFNIPSPPQRAESTLSLHSALPVMTHTPSSDLNEIITSHSVQHQNGSPRHGYTLHAKVNNLLTNHLYVSEEAQSVHHREQLRQYFMQQRPQPHQPQQPLQVPPTPMILQPSGRNVFQGIPPPLVPQNNPLNGFLAPAQIPITPNVTSGTLLSQQLTAHAAAQKSGPNHFAATNLLLSPRTSNRSIEKLILLHAQCSKQIDLCWGNLELSLAKREQLLGSIDDAGRVLDCVGAFSQVQRPVPQLQTPHHSHSHLGQYHSGQFK